jgi:hypothetical protein
MNSSYGKTVQKAAKTKVVYVSGEEKLIDLLSSKESVIRNYTNIIGSNKYRVEIGQSIAEHASLPHIGAEILSMAKRPMNEIVDIAADVEAKLYYTDTDSWHIRNKDIAKITKEFTKRYKRDLVGKDLGQFHCDFDGVKGCETLGAEKTIVIWKKNYCDVVVHKDLKTGELVRTVHFRLKGVPSNVVKKQCEINKETVVEMYEALSRGEARTFDLTLGISFDIGKNGTIYTRKEFSRTIRSPLNPICRHCKGKSSYKEKEKAFTCDSCSKKCG